MNLGDLILFALIGFLLYKMLKRNKPSENSEFQDDGRELTETQKIWRKKRLEDMIETNQREQSENMRAVNESIVYVQKNIRPFNFYEWLIWGVQPELFQAYLMSVVMMFLVVAIVPIFIGFKPIWWVVTAFLIFYDIKLYNKMRILEVTLWDDEWHKKFGNE